jgi:dual 3',5'-cyclic-AMP and -GMP phosphodiesterase 11
MLDFEPQSLLCVPIFNVHGVMVGVFQVITQKRAMYIPPETAGSSSPILQQRVVHKANFSVVEKESFRYVCVITGTAIWNMALAKAHQLAQSRIECLLKLNRNISAEINAFSVLDQIVSVSYELLNAEKIQLYVRDEGTDEFYVASRGTSQGVSKEEFQTEHNGIAGYVMRTGQLVLTNSAQAHPEFDPSFDEKLSFSTRQVLCAPVKDPDANILAVVCASNKVDGGEFNSEDALYLNYAADAAGISLHKSLLLREVITSQRITEARLRLTDFVSTSTSIAEFVNLIMEEGKKLMSCDRFGFLLVDQLKKELWITQIDGKNIRMPMNKGISGLVALTGEPVCTRDAYTHAWFDPTVDLKTGYRTTSVLCMPVFEDHAPTNPKIVAVAMCINKKDSARILPFTATDTVNMARYCQEIQFALGRLSLDISYYKVVSDCGMNGMSASNPLLERIAGEEGGGPELAHDASSWTDTAEGEIVTSIVHKYCQPSEVEGLDMINTASSTLCTDPWLTASSSISDEDATLHESVHTSIVGVGDVDRWDLSCLDLSNGEIFMSIAVIFRVFGIGETFRISHDKISTFLSHVASHYRPNPFHNFQHAFQVMHATYSIIRLECSQYFSLLDIFTMLIAALCHGTSSFSLSLLFLAGILY